MLYDDVSVVFKDNVVKRLQRGFLDDFAILPGNDKLLWNFLIFFEVEPSHLGLSGIIYCQQCT